MIHPAKSRPLVITHIRKDSPADYSQLIKPGDRLLEINNIKLGPNVTLDQALMQMASGGDQIKFTIEYDTAVVPAVEQSSGPLMIEVVKDPGLNLGISLKHGVNRLGENSVLIHHIKSASIADRCGALQINDEILSIDGQNLKQLALQGVVKKVFRLQIFLNVSNFYPKMHLKDIF